MASAKIPPHSDDAEQSVLGAILLSKEAISRVAERLVPDDFYDETNGRIFKSMLTLFEQGKPIDILTLTKELKKDKKNRIEAAFLEQDEE